MNPFLSSNSLKLGLGIGKEYFFEGGECSGDFVGCLEGYFNSCRCFRGESLFIFGGENLNVFFVLVYLFIYLFVFFFFFLVFLIYFIIFLNLFINF